MEEGALRADVNVSVELVGEGTGRRGERCEVKNLNSLRSVHRAIDFEVARHTAALQAWRKNPRTPTGWKAVT